ncbi:GNAT family N-acetyltransferase [Oceanicoccus sp. KOV_DT_Chl]|uniref:GNAT family N-acetyltransferase n=1 Tax=Oceanicoccus sp. KOV_DT_Chl TaxID=1904639 RepID=UPI00190E620D|nr:GNAT family N-acetyltransferase [Oceanicoccus sp. KOV_DT_Chl]
MSAWRRGALLWCPNVDEISWWVMAGVGMEFEWALDDDGETLAELRVLAMRESLEAIGRFKPERARQRFLDRFDPTNTRKVFINGELVAFYVVLDKVDYLLLDHLYVHPDYQGRKIGSNILAEVIASAREKGKDIRLGALKGSRSNDFYKAHGFTRTHTEEYDNFYAYNIR